jgi:hypothetical protein
MLLFFKAAAIIVAMTLIIPLAVWGITGSRSHGWHAWRQYLGIMGVMVAVGCGLGLLGWLGSA